MPASAASSTYASSTKSFDDDKAHFHGVPQLRYIDENAPQSGRASRFFSKLTGRSSPTPDKSLIRVPSASDKPSFVVGGARVERSAWKPTSGPSFVVGGARVEPSSKKTTGPAFVVGGPRVEPSSWKATSGPSFVVGGARVEPRR